MIGKLQVFFILLFSSTVLLILLLLHGPLKGNHWQQAANTRHLSNLHRTFTNMMRPYNIEDRYQQVIASTLSKMGYTLSDLPDPSKLWTENVELCIMFNLNGVSLGDNQEVIELLIAYYHPFFSHLTLLFDGDPAGTKRPIAKYLSSYVDVLGCDSHVGWYQHKCIRRCLQQGTTETKGFLYIADDMFIDVSNMAELPTSKVWFIPPGIAKYSEIIEMARNTRPTSWWWGPPTNSAANLEIEINNLPSEWKDQLTKTAGFPDQFKALAISDIIYIPQTIAPKMEQVLTHIINTAPLFCEVATNLAVNIVAPDLVYFRDGYLWEDKTIEAIDRAAQGAHFVHPVKLGVKQQQDLWIQYMKKQLEIATQKKKSKLEKH